MKTKILSLFTAIILILGNYSCGENDNWVILPPLPKTFQDPLYIVGDGLYGWGNEAKNIGKDLQVFFADTTDVSLATYTYTGYFYGEKGLKFPTKAGDWDTAIGYKGGSLIPNGGDNFPTPKGNGVYTLTIDTKGLTVSMTPYSGTPTEYPTMEVIGDGANGWGDPDGIAMTQPVKHIWVASNVSLKSGGDKSIKFRTDKSWSNNWGARSKKEQQKLPYGIGKFGGDNIIVPADGEYYIAFNDITLHYIVIPMSDLPAK